MGREELLDEAIHRYSAAVSLVDPVRLQAWAERGLTMPTLKVLMLLREQPGAPSGVLAGRLGVTPSTVTGLVDRLVRQGLVERSEDRLDRRLVRNMLSDEGRRAVRELELRSRELLTGILGNLDDEQIGRLVQALGDLLGASEERLASALT